MRLIWPNWTLSYFTNRFTLYFFVFIFAASNTTILVITALPHSPGEIPRWEWPVAVAVVIGAGLVYWGILRLLMVPWGKGEFTLGSIIGLEPHIYESNADDHPEDIRPLMLAARHEGMPSLVKYKVSHFNQSFGQLSRPYQTMYRFLAL